MESGYVATRPRFTRLRRKFGVSYKLLTAEDLRVLDIFETKTVQGKAGAFYFPNLIANGSFEIPGPGGTGVAGWTPDPDGLLEFAVVPWPNAVDGGVSLRMLSYSQTVATGEAVNAGFVSSSRFGVSTGDVVALNAMVQVYANGIPTPATASLQAVLTVQYANSSTNDIVQTLASTLTTGFVPVSTSFTIPDFSGSAAVSATFRLVARIDNEDGSSPLSVAGGEVVFFVDSLGLALASTVQPYGRMPGSQPLPGLFRFTKNISGMDNPSGWAGGGPVYDVSFEITEV